MCEQKSLLEEYGLINQPVKWKFDSGEEKTFLVVGGEIKKISTGEIKDLGLMIEIGVSETETDKKKYSFGDPELFEIYLQDNDLRSKKVELTDKHYDELVSAFKVK